jgi:GT2 family glycosyltransferase
MNDSAAASISESGPKLESGIAISVVIPTYRRFELLRRCLTAVCAQDFAPERFEVIVADDDASPGRSALMREWIAQEFVCLTGKPRVRYVLVTDTQGPAGARNRGWREAHGEVIAFTDDDTIPDPSWLSRGWAAMARGFHAVAGTIRMPLRETPTDYERNAAGLSTAEFATANCFVRRAALEAVGGFDERFTAAWREDSDLQFALLERGFSCGSAPDAIVVHPIRPAAWGVSIAQQRKIVFDALLFKKHRQRYREHIRSSPPWRYYVIVGLALMMAAAAAASLFWIALATGLAWAALTVHFCLQRLAGNSHAWPHVLEMAITSVVLPPLGVYWRLRGAVRYRVLFL